MRDGDETVREKLAMSGLVAFGVVIGLAGLAFMSLGLAVMFARVVS